jgi:cyclophilin family peptidyl-prolyl cis-trans isomerase
MLRARLFILLLLMLALTACIGSAATPTPLDSLALFTPTAASQLTPSTLPTQPAHATALSGGNGQQYAAAPAMTIDPTKIYLATLMTDKGDIVVELLADKAPVTVNNFIFLAGEGFYDNTTFHRVLTGFMAQGGDPTGTGSGGPGYDFADEFDRDLRFEEAGLLAMANSGPGTNGSQFFITYVPTPHLTGKHTIFGKVVDGLEIALALTPRDPDTNPAFTGDKLLSVEITEAAQSQLPPPTATPVLLRPELVDGRPLASVPPAQRVNLYTGAPAMIIDTAKNYVATIKTSKGDIVVQLHPADAPNSVNNFVVLAGLGYWDNFPVNFILPGEFALTGSPAGDPSSDIGYVLDPEVKLLNKAGSLGYWYRAESLGSSGSQIYFEMVDSPQLDQEFTVFGSITAGLDVVAALTTEDTIISITVAEQ